MGQYAELASKIYTVIAATLGELQPLAIGTPERLAKLKLLNDLIGGMASVTAGMAQNSTIMHDGIVAVSKYTLHVTSGWARILTGYGIFSFKVEQSTIMA